MIKFSVKWKISSIKIRIIVKKNCALIIFMWINKVVISGTQKKIWLKKTAKKFLKRSDIHSGFLISRTFSINNLTFLCFNSDKWGESGERNVNKYNSTPEESIKFMLSY